MEGCPYFAPPQIVVRPGSAGWRRWVAVRVERVDGAALQLVAVAAHTPTPSWFSSVKGWTALLATSDRLGLERLFLTEVPSGLEQPLHREPKDHERDQHDTPALELQQLRGLERLIGPARADLRRGHLRLAPLSTGAAARTARAPVRKNRIAPKTTSDAPARFHLRQHAVHSARRHAEGPLLGLIGRVGTERGGPSFIVEVSTITLPSTTSSPGNGRGRAARGRACTRRPGCTSSRGTGTRTIARIGRTVPGSRGARTAGTAA